ncbi:TfoX/Sxy family protein [Dactylosporangium sp. CA-139066]|uniref:TfoX/Sxy family protein n=1 Tax=Dactylosporangium sp. CA-139066 TaxID=3239930 RepID=UPI003D8BB0BC
MAYDEGLAGRIAARLSGTETKRMFGGLVFLRDGSIVAGVYGPDLLVRVADPAAETARPGVRPFEMGGRPTRGFVLVDGDGLDDETLEAWLTRR